ncbi:DUF4811 domain-containing protein [Streptococcus hongkongensis]|nr:membrane protein [Streptococcus uberis]
MIILIICLATVLTFISWMYIDKAILRYSLGFLSILFLAGSIGVLTNHFTNHTGMVSQMKTTTKPIYSAGSDSLPFGILIYKELGTKADSQVLVFRDKPSDKEATAHYIPNKKQISEAIKKTATYQLADVDQAQALITTKRYVWKSPFYKFLFGIGGENGLLISQSVLVKIPKDTWLSLTPEEANRLKELAPKLQAANQAKFKADPNAAMQMKLLQEKHPKQFIQLQIKTIKEALAEDK